MNTQPSASLQCRRFAAAVVMTLLLWGAPRPASAEITQGELDRFVRGYLAAAQQPTPVAEVAHYAKRVRYFDSGTVDHEFVAEDQRRYYKLWPERSFELLEGPEVVEQESEAATVRFMISYEVRGAGRRATGMTENTMGVRRFGGELRIVAMSERKVNPADLQRPPATPRMENPAARTLPAVPRTKPAPPPAPPPVADLPPAARPTRKPEPRDMPVLPERQTPESDAQANKPGASRGDLDKAPAKPDTAPGKATPVPGSPGLVYPPGAEHTPINMIDVRGLAPGQKVKDPRTGQIFIVP